MKLLKDFNIIANNKKLYVEAFTHKSYTNERKKKGKDYQRLEWLGDAILQQKASTFIYNNCPNLSEGEMTLLRKNATKNETLAQFSRMLNLVSYVKVGKSKDAINEKLHSDLFESFIGALTEDGHEAIVDVILESTLLKLIMDTVDNPENLKNPKTKLQELIKVNPDQSFEYLSKKNLKTNLFICNVKIDNIKMGTGKGKTKQKAEIAAALDALKKLKK